MKKIFTVFAALLFCATMFAAKLATLTSGTGKVISDGGQPAHFVVVYDSATVGSLNKKLQFQDPNATMSFADYMTSQHEESLHNWENEHWAAEDGFSDVFRFWERKNFYVRIVGEYEPAKYTIKLIVEKIDFGCALGEMLFGKTLAPTDVILVGKVEYINEETGEVLGTIAINGVRGSADSSVTKRLHAAFVQLSYTLIGMSAK